MKKSLAKKVFGRVSVAHGLIILLTILMSSFRGCAPKPEVITFVDLAGGPAPASEPAAEAAPGPAPEMQSEPEQKPKPKPKPKPEKKPALKPVVTNTPPQKVETNTPPKKAESKKPAVTNAPPKPKTLEQRLKEVRQGGTPAAASKTKQGTSSRPAVDYSGLRNALNSAATGSGSGRGGSSSGSGSGSGGGMRGPFDEYYDSVKQQMYAVWQQPAGAPIGLTVTATVRVERNGIVALKSITRRSGNGQFDQSVQSALNATSRLPAPPADLPDLNIVIVFELSD